MAPLGSRLFVQHRLPVLIGGLLAVAIGGYGWGAYREVRRSSLAATHERIDRAAIQVRELVESSLRAPLAEVSRAAAHPAIAAYLARPVAANAPAAHAALDPLAHGEQSAGAELWSAAGEQLLARGPSGAGLDAPTVAVLIRDARDAAPALVGPPRGAGETILYDLVAPVLVSGQAAGYVVLHRTLTAVPRAGRQLADIIGTGAALRLGNRGGDLWTDLTAPVAPPAPEVRGGAGAVEYEDPVRGAMLARAVSVAGTPWLLVVELPRAAALAGTERFLVRAMVAGALFVLAGAGAGWLLSRRLTVPRIGRDRTDEVLALNRELEAFSYSVSHDLRAPLRAIDGFSRILSEDHAAGLGPEAARLLGVIRTNARHMGHLIDDLLAFSRLGRKELVTTDVDMAALARAAADELRAGAPERAVEVELGALPAARGDWALLRQVWVNLLSNAFKYSRGRVPARITVAAEVRNGETVYLVSDNGVGFDMAYGDKLFGVFQRLHRADQFEGTGVGLAIVQRIVHRHGGRVWAEAAPDAGATFSFTLEAREGA